MSPEKLSYLEDMRAQLGLSKEQGDKLIKAVRTEVYGSSAVTEVSHTQAEAVTELQERSCLHNSWLAG